ncbi:MAG: NAD(P)H-dependent oxidoreductase [Candidatus Omnitrophica bacterium]|nr:NAD(P)H-dependent oxidoreductase [Candidatus Omnitrophota bacterium]MDE2009214.1 NAD(P)H-dependent oxidoreductase [Candidatus Omnitrophota bacterium]MDE2213735.1 NAD(P)H-dependent oxidoreductase [Candidatus Omnitrophota bacterium]
MSIKTSQDPPRRDIMNDLSWRYATKKFDPTRKIPRQDFAHLLEVLRFSPSSFGLQPWKFVIVQDAALRKKLRPHAWGQSQITDADTLIVFCALKTMDEGHVRNYVDLIATTRGVARESLLDYEKMLVGTLAGKSAESVSHWMKNQVYIALGVFLAECARRKIDACPMEGFDPQKFDEILELPQQGLESVVLCTVGYRAIDDHYAALKKVRFDLDKLIINRL